MAMIKSLLAIRLSALGDICMTLPVIDSFCRAYPDVKLTLLTSKPGAIITKAVLHLPNLEVVAINKKDYSGLLGANRLYKMLRTFHFDAIADLHDVLRTKWTVLRYRIAGFPVAIIDKGRSDKKKLVSHKVEAQLTSGIDRYKKVFTDLGFDFTVDYQGKDHRLDSTAKLISIGIAPFAQHQGKIYPVEKMQEVVNRLVEARPDLHIYLFGGPEDQAKLQPWANAHPEQVTNVAGKQTFAEDLALMSGLKVMVSMDSANMHLASLVGLRCISIWGATHIHAGFLGYGQQAEDVIEQTIPCRPCSIYGNKPCKFGDYRCLNNISPEEVTKKILNCL